MLMMLSVVGNCLHGGQLLLMMRSLCGTRFTRTPADADDAWLLRGTRCTT